MKREEYKIGGLRRHRRPIRESFPIFDVEGTESLEMSTFYFDDESSKMYIASLVLRKGNGLWRQRRVWPNSIREILPGITEIVGQGECCMKRNLNSESYRRAASTEAAKLIDEEMLIRASVY
jgi:hypothetical protein